jgi:hypothetical protein
MEGVLAEMGNIVAFTRIIDPSFSDASGMS